MDINKEERKRKKLKWIGLERWNILISFLLLCLKSPFSSFLFVSFTKRKKKKKIQHFFLTSYNASEKVVTFTFDAAVKSVSDLQTNNLLNILQICGQGWTLSCLLKETIFKPKVSLCYML